jgi:hypothetical protein
MLACEHAVPAPGQARLDGPVQWLRRYAALVWGSGLFLAAAATRSNGAMLAGYTVFASLRLWRAHQAAIAAGGRSKGIVVASAFAAWVAHWALTALLVSAVATPYVALQYHAYFRACEVAPDALRVAVASWWHIQLPARAAAPDRPWCALASTGGTTQLGPLAARLFTDPWVALPGVLARLALRTPPLYAFVQSEYWGVGLFRYFKLKHAPQFLLAAPALAVAAAAASEYSTRPGGLRAGVRELFALAGAAALPLPLLAMPQSSDASESSGLKKDFLATGDLRRAASPARQRAISRFARRTATTEERVITPQPDWDTADAFPYICHWIVLTLVGAVAMHVQVLTRLVAAASPALYWFLARTWLAASQARRPATVSRSCLSALWEHVNDVRFWMLGWCVGYTLAGGLLFPNFLPWT